VSRGLLLKGYNEARPENQHYYLIALCSMLRHIPHAILHEELPAAFPLLIKSLSLPQESLRLASLDTLRQLVSAAPDLVSQHVPSLLSALFDSVRFTASAVRRNPQSLARSSWCC